MPITQVNPAQVPLNTPILVSKAEPQRLKVIILPSPANEYQTPGAVPKAVVQVPTASEVADEVLPVMVWPQAILIAPEQRSFTTGAEQVLARVKAPALVPKPVTKTK